jgi:lipopolysaccharide biosynthesis regulator YciM
MGVELLFLLLPVAALSGWLIGHRGEKKNVVTDAECDDFSEDYFKGLNYLLNEQPDKAIEIFVRMLEVNSDTVETHFALANLFRRRGEVERAIRIHQNLIARPTLRKHQRSQALYELACDYMSAGLLDRAESLFREVENEELFGSMALRHLREIFEQEKEWANAIDVSKRLKPTDEEAIDKVIAHYCCELAEEALQKGDQAEASRMIKQANSEDNNCVRATLLESWIAMEKNNCKLAIKLLNRIERQDPKYITEAIQPLMTCYAKIGKQEEMLGYLEKISQIDESVNFMIARAELIRKQQGEKAAEHYMAEQLRKHPTLGGLDYLIGLKLVSDKDNSDLAVLKELLSKFINNRPGYLCSNCGYTTKSLHWHCPSCKQWSTIKPITVDS